MTRFSPDPIVFVRPQNVFPTTQILGRVILLIALALGILNFTPWARQRDILVVISDALSIIVALHGVVGVFWCLVYCALYLWMEGRRREMSVGLKLSKLRSNFN
ncbi:hypothetical protein BCR33DRAFT_711387, partial [Rhizoclosmatium globosum]